MKLNLEKSALLAAVICASKDDIRYYLNGVHVRCVPGKETDTLVYTGTDGHMLFAGTLPAVWLEDREAEGFDMIIPFDAVKAACKGKGATVTLERMAGGMYSIGTQIFTPIDGKFPDYSRVIPATVSGELAQFDADLLARGLKALRAYFGLEKLVPTLHHNGTGGAVLSGESRDALVVVMPWQAKGTYNGFAMPEAFKPEAVAEVQAEVKAA
jgi:DNA polymerase-3 subunit beta